MMSPRPHRGRLQKAISTIRREVAAREWRPFVPWVDGGRPESGAGKRAEGGPGADHKKPSEHNKPTKTRGRVSERNTRPSAPGPFSRSSCRVPRAYLWPAPRPPPSLVGQVQLRELVHRG